MIIFILILFYYVYNCHTKINIFRFLRHLFESSQYRDDDKSIVAPLQLQVSLKKSSLIN